MITDVEIPDPLLEVMQCCWKMQSRERPTMKAILERLEEYGYDGEEETSSD